MNDSANLSHGFDSLDSVPNWLYAPYQRRQQWPAYLFVYGMYGPITTIIGIVGNMLCFATIYPKIKERVVFVQQAAVILNDIFATVLSSTFHLGLMLGSRQIEGFHFIRRMGPVMWYFAHISLGGGLTLFMVSQLLLVATSTDRMFSLYIPIRYKLSNHFARSICMIVVCYIAGIVATSYQYFRYDIIWDTENGVYFMVQNVDHINSAYNKISAWVYIVIYLVTIVVMWILIPMIVVKYRKIQKANAATRNGTNKATQNVNEDLLTVLLIAEGLLQIFGGSLSLTIYYSVYFFVPAGLVKSALTSWSIFSPRSTS